MSDIRMQSIFLDEEFVLEDNSDVALYNSRRKSIDRTKSQLGHSKYTDRDEVKKHEEREIKRAPSTRNSISGSHSSFKKDGSVKRAADDKNRAAKNAYDKDEKSRSVSHKNQAVSRKANNESTLMDMIHII